MFTLFLNLLLRRRPEELPKKLQVDAHSNLGMRNCSYCKSIQKKFKKTTNMTNNILRITYALLISFQIFRNESKYLTKET